MFEDAADITGGTFCISSLPGNCTAGDFWDVDMNANYKLTKNIDVFLNVYNVGDTLPPVDQINYAGINYNPTFAQAGIIGRAFKVGVHFKYAQIPRARRRPACLTSLSRRPARSGGASLCAIPWRR